MFEELKAYAEKVKSGMEDQIFTVMNASASVSLSPKNNHYENHGKYMEIKDYIESHIHGVTVHVTGGQKLLTKDEEDLYTRAPIIIRTFKNNEPYAYSEVKVDGIFMDEKDGAMRVYDNYIGFFIDGGQYIKTGMVSQWEQFISKWIWDNNFTDESYYCEDNQVIKFTEGSCEIIVSDINKDVVGIAVTDISNIDSESDIGLVILCRDKQILIGYERYFIMKVV